MYTLSQSMPKTSNNKVKPNDSGMNDHPQRKSSSASSGHCNQTTNQQCHTNLDVISMYSVTIA